MATKPTVVVFGSTGAQGGSVVKALLRDGGFNIVGITRDPEKPKAKELTSQGVLMAKADYNDEASLLTVLTDTDAVFANTNFWEAGLSEGEQAKRLSKCAKEAGVKHFIWSTLPNAEEESGGKFTVDHFTSKAKVDSFIAEQGFQYYTFVVPACYYGNFKHMLTSKGEDGVFNFNMALKAGDVLTAFDEEEDTGKPVPIILKDPENWGHGQRVTYAGTNATYQEYVDTFKRVTGKEARLNEVPVEAMAKSSKELAEMFSWFSEYGYYGKKEDIHVAEKIVSLTSWEDYIKKNLGVWT